MKTTSLVLWSLSPFFKFRFTILIQINNLNSNSKRNLTRIYSTLNCVFISGEPTRLEPTNLLPLSVACVNVLIFSRMPGLFICKMYLKEIVLLSPYSCLVTFRLHFLEVRNLRIALNDPKKYEEKLKKGLETDKIFMNEELQLVLYPIL